MPQMVYPEPQMYPVALMPVPQGMPQGMPQGIPQPGQLIPRPGMPMHPMGRGRGMPPFPGRGRGRLPPGTERRPPPGTPGVSSGLQV